MPYSKAHKAGTRARIVTAAGGSFRRDGVQAVGIPRLMHEAGLTHGGFYAHFPSKDALVAEVCDTAITEVGRQLIEAVRAAPEDEKLRTVVRWYLSRTHRDHPESGCAIAALGADVAHEPAEVRASFTAALGRYAEALAEVLPGPEHGHARRDDVLLLLTGMAGTLTTARAVSDRALSDHLLLAGRQLYMETFGARMGGALPTALTTPTTTPAESEQRA